MTNTKQFKTVSLKLSSVSVRVNISVNIFLKSENTKIKLVRILNFSCFFWYFKTLHSLFSIFGLGPNSDWVNA